MEDAATTGTFMAGRAGTGQEFLDDRGPCRHMAAMPRLDPLPLKPEPASLARSRFSTTTKGAGLAAAGHGDSGTRPERRR